MKIAVIDIGSNTVKMDTFNVKGDNYSLLSAKSERGGLVKYRKDSSLTPEGYNVLYTLLEKYVTQAVSSGCEKTYVFATQSLRGLKNAEDVCDRIKSSLGVDIDIISGEEEALYSFCALAHECTENDEGIMADMGGGSLELADFSHKKHISLCSLPLGALYVKETLGINIIPNADDEKKIANYVTNILSKAPTKSKDTVYIIGGTARTLFSLCFEGKTEISLEDAEKAYSILSASKEKTFKFLSVKAPKRVDNFMTGYYIFICLCRHFSANRLVLCKSGVRDGYLADKLEKEDIK